MKPEKIDPLLRVALIRRTEEPQRCIYAAMHQDYCEDFVADQELPEESVAGRIAVKRLLHGERGHYGCLEHPQITLNVGWFPHSVMQQARTHRVGVSFDVQSGRYTSQRILDVVAGVRSVEEVFYLRPPQRYRDRAGADYEYTEDERIVDLGKCYDFACHYGHQIQQGKSEEHARELIPYAIRQHFVVSFTMRAMMHFLDLRSKLDAQLEIQWLCDLMWPHFADWAPEVANWYSEKRLHKAKLAP
jgi:thymidylate synthase (FAD)